MVQQSAVRVLRLLVLTTSSPGGVGCRQLGAGLAECDTDLATPAVPTHWTPRARAHVCIGAVTCNSTQMERNGVHWVATNGQMYLLEQEFLAMDALHV